MLHLLVRVLGPGDFRSDETSARLSVNSDNQVLEQNYWARCGPMGPIWPCRALEGLTGTIGFHRAHRLKHVYVKIYIRSIPWISAFNLSRPSTIVWADLRFAGCLMSAGVGDRDRELAVA